MMGLEYRRARGNRWPLRKRPRAVRLYSGVIHPTRPARFTGWHTFGKWFRAIHPNMNYNEWRKLAAAAWKEQSPDARRRWTILSTYGNGLMSLLDSTGGEEYLEMSLAGLSRVVAPGYPTEADTRAFMAALKGVRGDTSASDCESTIELGEGEGLESVGEDQDDELYDPNETSLASEESPRPQKRTKIVHAAPTTSLSLVPFQWELFDEANWLEGLIPLPEIAMGTE